MDAEEPKLHYRFWLLEILPEEEVVIDYIKKGKLSEQMASLGTKIDLMAPEIKEDYLDLQESFNVRGYWGRSLDGALSYYIMSSQINRFFEYRQPIERSEEWPYVALGFFRTMHFKACSILHEIVLLLNHGFSMGAHARIRALYELMVIMKFIIKNGLDCLELYYVAGQVQMMLLQFEHYKYCHQGTGAYKATSDELKNKIDTTIKSYKNLRLDKPWGWAKPFLKSDNASFRSIEENVENEWMRPQYKLASFSVHSEFESFLSQPQGSGRFMVYGQNHYGLDWPLTMATSLMNDINQLVLNLVKDNRAELLRGLSYGCWIAMNKVIEEEAKIVCDD
jgi:hypothetical protein